MNERTKCLEEKVAEYCHEIDKCNQLIARLQRVSSFAFASEGGTWLVETTLHERKEYVALRNDLYPNLLKPLKKCLEDQIAEMQYQRDCAIQGFIIFVETHRAPGDVLRFLREMNSEINSDTKSGGEININPVS